MDRQWWYFLIHGQADKHTGVYANFYAAGTHLGEALDHALAAAASIDLFNIHAVETAPWTATSQHHPDNLKSVTGFIHDKEALHSYEIDPSQPFFIAPTGIIKSAQEGGYDYELIEEKFIAYKNQGNGIYEIELIAGQEKLIPTFTRLAESIEETTTLQIFIHDHWENQQTEEWIGSHFTNHVHISQFLNLHKSSLLQNGFVDCVIDASAGDTQLTLDQHKKIKLRTTDHSLFKKAHRKVKTMGFKQATELHDLEFDYYHWHYRPSDSLSREELITVLTREKFCRASITM